MERTHHERKAAAAEQERQVREAAEAAMVAQGLHHLQGGDGRDQAQRRGARADPPHRAQDDRHGRRAAGDGPRLGPIAAIEITFDVDDGGTARGSDYEHLFGPRAAKRYKPGRTVTVWIDLTDPDAICPGAESVDRLACGPVRRSVGRFPSC